MLNTLSTDDLNAAVPSHRANMNGFIVFTALTVIALLIGAWNANTLSFVNDDAFVSFRYAKNFAEGKGLVFNEGERDIGELGVDDKL